MTTSFPENITTVSLKNKRPIIIRKLEKTDVDGVWQNFNDVVAEKIYLPVYTPVFSKWEKSNWFKEMQHGNNFCLVAIDPKQLPDKQVIGQITVEDIPWEAGDHVGQLGIIVKTHYRNLGVGYHLIQSAIKYAQNIGKKKLILSTLASNTRGVHLYEKCGFKQIGIYSKQYLILDEYEDEILMENWIAIED